MEYKVKSTHRFSRDRAVEMGFGGTGCLCIDHLRESYWVWVAAAFPEP